MSPRAARTPAHLVVGLTAIALSLAGCGTTPALFEPEPVPTVTATPTAPPAATTVAPAPGGPELAVQLSRLLFSGAPVVVLAPASDPAGQLRAASLAASLGVPVLLTGEASRPGLVAEELVRLGTQTVLGVGDVAGLVPGLGGADDGGAEGAEEGQGGAGVAQAALDAPAGEVRQAAGAAQTATPSVEATLVDLPGDAAGIADLLGVELSEGSVVPGGGEVAALAGLAAGSGALLRLDGSPDPAAGAGPTSSPEPSAPDGATRGAPRLPVLAETMRLAGVTVLSDGTPAQTAAVGIARAAGAVVLSVPSRDPRSSSDVIAALAAAKPATVIGLGAGFGSAEQLQWRVATAATGVELPGGGQLVFEGKRYVALYGTPGTAALGVLGEQGVQDTIVRARAHADAIQPYTEDTIVPSLEIIASIASAGAGPDGDYSNTRPVADLRPLVDAAREAGQYVVLDLQPGRTDFLTQARMYEELLLEPHVGLALDPEWRLKPHQRHLVQIGSVEIDEVNQVVRYLADLTRDNRLPQKLLVLHQFRLSMLQGRERLDTSRSELALMIHVDGQGSQPAKQNTWNTLRRDAPEVYWGWKNFYDEDVPMLNAEQTMRVEPLPHLITYQ